MTLARFGHLLAVLAIVMASTAAPEARSASWIRISDLDNLHLGRWSGRGDLQAEDDHCVRIVGGPWRRTFRLEAYGSGPGGAFALRNGRDHLPFEVAYDDGRGYRTFRSPGDALAGLEGSHNHWLYRRCRWGHVDERKRVRIRVQEADLATAPAGRFHGHLLLMVVPE